MKLDDIYSGGASLKASDLQGSARKVKIASYEIREFDNNGQKQKRAVLAFEGKDKGLVVNKTNAQIIAQNAGSEDLDDWIGKEIILYPTKVDFSGNMVDAIRIKEEIPEVALDQDVPF